VEYIFIETNLKLGWFRPFIALFAAKINFYKAHPLKKNTAGETTGPRLILQCGN
jgi:hypothetical protein